MAEESRLHIPTHGYSDGIGPFLASENTIGRNNNANRPKIISPYENAFRFWQGFLLILSMYSVFMTPFEIAFYRLIKGNLVTPLCIVDLIIDGFFWVDVMATFWFGYLDKKHVLRHNHSDIAKNYLKPWFFVDVLSLLPNLLFLKTLPRVAPYIFVVKLLHLSHFSRMHIIIFQVEKHTRIHFVIVQLLEFVVVAFFFLHCRACMSYIFFVPEWLKEGKPLDKETLGEQYITMIYWSITTLSSVGYGDLVATK